MTDTKTKPDGWVQEDFRYEIEAGDYVCVHRASVGYSCKPVCLVPPALLDAIDEVEEAFQTYFECVEREDKVEEEFLKEKLDKLKEVRG